jgi:hypothetical protein
MRVITIFLFVLLAFCQKESSNSNKEAILLLALRSNSSTSCTPTSSSPGFSTLAAAGTTNNCLNGCHDQTNKTGNMVINDYNSVIQYVVKGSPEQSILYGKISSGSMRVNSNATINTAVYNWIKGCAVQ